MEDALKSFEETQPSEAPPEATPGQSSVEAFVIGKHGARTGGIGV